MPKLEEWQWEHVKAIIEKSPLTFDQINMAIVARERQAVEEKSVDKPLSGQLGFDGSVAP